MEGCGQISGSCKIWNGGQEEMEMVIHMAEYETWAWVGESPKRMSGKNVRWPQAVEWEREEEVKLMLGSQLQGWRARVELFLRWEHRGQAGLWRKLLSLATLRDGLGGILGKVWRKPLGPKVVPGSCYVINNCLSVGGRDKGSGRER